MNSFHEIAKNGNIRNIENSIHLDNKQVFDYFIKILDVGLESFIKEYDHTISLNEKAILTFLHFVYNDSKKTIAVYCRHICKFLNFAKSDFRSINTYNIKMYVEHLKSNGYKTSYVNNQIASLKSFYGHFTDISVIATNPAKTIKMQQGVQHRFVEKVLTREQANILLDYTKKNADIRDYVMLSFMYTTGLRVAELVNILWGDLFKDAQGRNFVSIKGKGSKQRNVYVTKGLYEDLMIYRAFQYKIQGDEKAPGLHNLPMFPSRRKLTRKLTTYSVYRIVKNLGKQALEIDDLSPHWLRHTFATHARLKGATLEAVKQQLGHNKYDTTLLYEHGAHLTSPAGAVFDDD